MFLFKDVWSLHFLCTLTTTTHTHTHSLSSSSSMASSPKQQQQQQQQRYSIGIALSAKKKGTFFNPSFLSRASAKGLDLVPIDPSLPISAQSERLDLLVHKLYDERWARNLEEFSARNPSVPVVDPLDRIRRIQDRVSMLESVSRILAPPNREQIVSDINNLNNHHHTFGVPKQITINDSAALEDPVALSGLSFPVLAKPLRADGSNSSHKMSLVFSSEALLKQPIPLVLQEFVNHGGVVFKVYVAGDYVTCVKRPSIRDISEEMMAELSKKGSLSFSLISNIAAGHELDETDTPPMSFITEIAQGLRRAMGLTLFNFDMIKDLRLTNHYLVIDINYFPGYEKIPDYETVMTDFMWNIVHEKKEQDVSSSVLGNGHENGKPLCCDRDEEEETVG